MMDDDRITMLSCPLCGFGGQIIEGDGKFFVTCDNCFCCVGEGYDSKGNPDHIFITPLEAASTWNQRVANPLLAAIQRHHDTRYGSIPSSGRSVIAPHDVALYDAAGVEYRRMPENEGEK